MCPFKCSGTCQRTFMHTPHSEMSWGHLPLPWKVPYVAAGHTEASTLVFTGVTKGQPDFSEKYQKADVLGFGAT